jgi:hypothetical protein
MTDELVESVARAICESKPDRAGFWETTPEPRRKGYRTQARAAIVATTSPKKLHGHQTSIAAKLKAQIEGGRDAETVRRLGL